MDIYYSRLARSALSESAAKMISVQDYLLQADAPTNATRTAARILASIRNLQDEILRIEAEEESQP